MEVSVSPNGTAKVEGRDDDINVWDIDEEIFNLIFPEYDQGFYSITFGNCK